MKTTLQINGESTTWLVDYGEKIKWRKYMERIFLPLYEEK